MHTKFDNIHLNFLRGHTNPRYKTKDRNKFILKFRQHKHTIRTSYRLSKLYRITGYLNNKVRIIRSTYRDGCRLINSQDIWFFLQNQDIQGHHWRFMPTSMHIHYRVYIGSLIKKEEQLFNII